MIDRAPYWHLSPLTGYSYLRDHRLLPKLQVIEDVDKIVVHTLKDRLLKDQRYPVDVVYAHQDRDFRKLLRTPTVIIENTGIQELGEIRTDLVFEQHPNGKDYLVNQHPIYYKFNYNIVCVEDSVVNVHRLFLAVKELVFPAVHGQRWITISLYKDASGNLYEHRKAITYGETDFGNFSGKDRYWYILPIEFFVVLHPLEWETMYGIETLRIVLESLPDTSVVYYQQDISLP